MAKRRIRTFIEGICLASVMVLGGCSSATAQYSDDEIKQIAEYIAYSYLKEDLGANSRLVDDQTIEDYEKDQAAWEAARKAGEEQKKSESKKNKEESSKSSNASSDSNRKKSDGATYVKSFAEFTPVYHLPEGVTLSYNGYTLCKSYSDSGNDAFALEAPAGKQLLIINFGLKNDGQAATMVDLFSKTNAISVMAGGKQYGVNKTILPNDLTTFCEEVGAGQERKLVYISEVDQSLTDGDEITLRLKNSEAFMAFELKQ